MAAHHARQQPPESRPTTENPQNSSMNRIQLLAAGDLDNSIPPFTKEIMEARILGSSNCPLLRRMMERVIPPIMYGLS